MVKKDTITLEHGSGSRLARKLLEEVLLPPLRNPLLGELTDAACFKTAAGKLAFTTDSFVVSPLFFPGGDIGKLAVCGTVNDLAMMGAEALYLSASLIIEEDFSLVSLKKVTASLGRWAKKAGVKIVTGDTKVVEKGNADKLYVNTAGLGRIPEGFTLSPERIRPGDAVIISGTAADHGMAILAAREKLDIAPPITSDCAPLNGLVRKMVGSGVEIKFMRDPTRGGTAAVLNELAENKKWGIVLNEAEIPIRPRVRAALEILGLDPLSLASEGRLLAVTSAAEAPRLIEIMKKDPAGKKSAVIGEVVSRPAGMVGLRTQSGGVRIISWPRGEQLPRIC